MRNISRRDFLKTAITAAAGAGGQRVARAQGSSPQEPLRLPSTPELEGWFYGKLSPLLWEPPDPDTATKISGILDELRREIPVAAPAAKRIAETVRLRIVKGGIDDKSLALRSTTLVEDKSKNVSFPADAGDYDHALMFLDLNRKALDVFSDRADLKAACAHELAHHILNLNPWLRDDPRFQPRSEEFTREWNGIKFEVRPNDLGFDIRRPTPLVPQDDAEAQRFEAIIAAKQRNYRDEIMADKLGAWLCGDEKAAEHVQTLLAGLPGHVADGEIGWERKPHPSPRARLAEIHASFEDMRKDKEAPADKPSPRGGMTL